MKEKQEHHFNLRVPLTIWSALEKMAEDEERSINWEIVKAISERVVRHQKGKMKHGQKED